MKKTILSIFMVIAICVMTATVSYAHIVTNISPLSENSNCSCGGSYSSACGGSQVDFYTQECPYDSGCTIIFRLYMTISKCTSCGNSPSEGYTPDNTHTHIYHSNCSYHASCPFDSAIASIKDNG